MTPSRPYLIRALHEWISDNDMTPYILVDAEQEGVSAPDQFVENGKIVFNISHRATQKLAMGNELLAFEARFSGSPMQISVPVPAVLAIYARENGKGMVFTEEGEDETPPPSGGGDEERSKRPTLRVVK